MSTKTIGNHMTPSPHSIGSEQTLTAAHDLMREHAIRHLPVLHGGKLVGLVSLRDLHLVETLKDVDPTQVTIDEAMTTEVYTVAPDTPLADVVRVMLETKLGSAVVVDGTRVAGVFTTTNALKALLQLLS
jgi:acetoin utilization protein AcuB